MILQIKENKTLLCNAVKEMNKVGAFVELNLPSIWKIFSKSGYQLGCDPSSRLSPM